MFALSDGYERYMGRWSRLLAPRYAAFAGVKDDAELADLLVYLRKLADSPAPLPN